MAFIYNVYERDSRIPSIKEKYGEKYATAQLRMIRQATMHELAEDIADRTTLHRADVMACLEVLPKSLAHYLTNGFGVDLGSLGSMSATCRCKPSSSEKDFTADLIKGARVRFTPGTEFKAAIAEAGFVRGELVGPLAMRRKPAKKTKTAESGQSTPSQPKENDPSKPSGPNTEGDPGY